MAGNKVEQLELNFMLNAKSVEQAGTALRTEVEKGIGQVSFDTLRRNAATASKKIGQDLKKALTQEITVDTSNLDKSLAAYQAKRRKVERKLALEAGKAGKAGDKAQSKMGKGRMRELQKLLRAERQIFKDRARSMSFMNREAKTYLKTMKKAAKLGGGGGLVAQLKGRGGGGGPGGGDILGGGKKKGGGKGGGLGKLGGMGKMLGGLTKSLGRVGVVLGGLVGAIGAVVGVVAGLIAVIMAADSAAKDLNKTMLASTGGADMLGVAYGGVSDQVDAMRQAALGAQFRLKSLAKENLEILKTVHEHGVTIREMTQDVKSAEQAMNHYSNAMSLVLQTSRMIGESAQTVAQNMATSSEELGLTLEGVAKRFSEIGRFAMESGFSTKRFYSMVIQATSGMSMYNVRLEEASGLLVRIGKILGQKTGGEFLQSLSKGFVNESMTQRIKRVKLAGTGNTQKVFEKSAQDTARTFARDLEENATDKSGKGIKLDLAAMTGGKFKGDMKDLGGEGLRKMLNKMNPEEQTKFMAKFSKELAKGNSQNADMLRQRLQTLIEVNKGSQGGLLNMSKELGSLDMGGKLNMLRKSMASMFPGKEIHELSTKQLAALESATGMQGEELHNMRRLTRGLEGNFKALEDQAKEGYGNMKPEDIVKDQKAQIQQFGAYVNKQGKIVSGTIDKDGNIKASKDKDGKPITIKDLDTYVQSQGKRMQGVQSAKNFNEDRSIAREIASNTWSMADMLKAGISIVLEKIYGAVRGILGSMPGADTYRIAVAKQAEEYSKAEKHQEMANETEKKIAEKEVELKKETDDTKKAAIEDEIKALNLKKQTHNMASAVGIHRAEGVFNADGSVSEKGVAATALDTSNTFLGASFWGGAETNDSIKVGQQVHDSVLSDEGKQLTASLADDPKLMEKLKHIAPDVFHTLAGAGKESVDMTPEQAADAKDKQVSAAQRFDYASTALKVGKIDTGSTFQWNDDDASNTEATGNWYDKNLIPNANEAGKTPLSAEGVTQFFGGEDVVQTPRVSREVGQGMLTEENSGVVMDKGGVRNRTDPAVVESTIGQGMFNVSTAQVENTGTDSRHGVMLSTGGEESAVHDTEVSGYVPTVAETHRLTQAGVAQPQDIFSEIVGHATDGGASTPKSVIDKHAFRLMEGSNTFEGSGQRVSKLKEEDASYITDPVDTSSSDTFENAVLAGQAGEMHSGVSISDGSDLAAEYAEIKKLLMTDFGMSESEASEEMGKGIVGAIEASEDGKLTYKGWRDWMGKNNTEVMNIYKKQDDNRKKRLVTLGNLKTLLEKMPDKQAEANTKAERKNVATSLAAMVGVRDEGEIKKLILGGKLKADGVGGKLRALMADPTTSEPMKEAIQGAFTKLGLKQDFIYQGGSRGGTITPIHGQDSFIGMRPRGPVDNAMSRGGGGNANINVFVYSNNMENVKQAIYQAARTVGVGGRVQNKAGKGNYGHKPKMG